MIEAAPAERWQPVIAKEAKPPAAATSGAATPRRKKPRRVTLPSIIKAKQKPLAVVEAARFGIDLAPASQTVRLEEPAVRRAGERVADIDALVAALASHHVFVHSGASA